MLPIVSFFHISIVTLSNTVETGGSGSRGGGERGGKEMEGEVVEEAAREVGKETEGEVVEEAPNDTAYKWWSCHSRQELLCKLCRTLPPPAMGARFTVFLGMPAMRTRWMAGAAAHKSG